MRLSKRLADLEAKAGDIELARLSDAMIALEVCDIVTALADRLDASGEPVPDGLLEAVEAADWSRSIKILEALECAD